MLGPTSFSPIIDAAIDIVEQNNGQYHVLVIIADGQVCNVIIEISNILLLLIFQSCCWLFSPTN